MKQFRPYRFPPLAQFKAASERVAGTEDQWQLAVSEGFAQGQEDGYELGLERGRQDGFSTGRAEGLQQGRDEGRHETLISFETLAQPVDAMLAGLKKIKSDYRDAQRCGRGNCWRSSMKPWHPCRRPATRLKYF